MSRNEESASAASLPLAGAALLLGVASVVMQIVSSWLQGRWIRQLEQGASYGDGSLDMTLSAALSTASLWALCGGLLALTVTSRSLAPMRAAFAAVAVWLLAALVRPVVSNLVYVWFDDFELANSWVTYVGYSSLAIGITALAWCGYQVGRAAKSSGSSIEPWMTALLIPAGWVGASVVGFAMREQTPVWLATLSSGWAALVVVGIAWRARGRGQSPVAARRWAQIAAVFGALRFELAIRLTVGLLVVVATLLLEEGEEFAQYVMSISAPSMSLTGVLLWFSALTAVVVIPIETLRAARPWALGALTGGFTSVAFAFAVTDHIERAGLFGPRTDTGVLIGFAFSLVFTMMFALICLRTVADAYAPAATRLLDIVGIIFAAFVGVVVFVALQGGGRAIVTVAGLVGVAMMVLLFVAFGSMRDHAWDRASGGVDEELAEVFMSEAVAELVEAIEHELGQRADPEKAGPMAAYLKTDMPFYGVQKKGIAEVLRVVRDVVTPEAQAEYEQAVRTVWALPHREEKYLAISLARRWKRFVTPVSISLYEQMIREGAWWDLVDEIASHLVGGALAKSPEEVLPVLDAWIDDSDLWIRRTAIIAQLRRKEKTDAARLFRYCRERAHEKEFFIRKAIGWSLRQYSYTDPEAVRMFIEDNQKALSGLSIREGAKQLKRIGMEPELDS